MQPLHIPRRLVFAAALTLGMPAVTAAQAYPSKPIRLVVPYPPGASNEIIGRALAQRLSEQLGTNMIVDTRPGAGGHIGAEVVARSAPDGYTLLLGTAGLQRPEMQSFVLSQGAEPAWLDPRATAAQFAQESVRWGKVAKAANIKVD